MSDSRRGFGLEIGFTDHLQVITANHYNTIAHFRTFQITTAHAKSFSVCCVFTSRSLVTALTVGCFNRIDQVFSSHTPFQQLTTHSLTALAN
jgi:hypothetical protein